VGFVSPTSIRSRILKDATQRQAPPGPARFTHVDPFEDTESAADSCKVPAIYCFTHVDPFEDTERTAREWRASASKRFTHVDPFEDTESLVVAASLRPMRGRFTHVDPFEDTESLVAVQRT